MLIRNNEQSNTPSPADLHVLLLDDNPHDLIAVERALERVPDKTYAVDSFSTLVEAAEYLEHHQDMIDICLVDYAIEAKTAFDFLRLFEQHQLRPLPVVVMTGQTQPDLDEKLLQAGVHDYWNKHLLESETLSRCLHFAHHRHQNYQIQQRQNVNKSRHLAHINHELRTPLNGIAGLTRMLERLWHKQDPASQVRVQACFDGIKTSTDTLMHLINELLDLSEIESGQFTLNRKPCDVEQLVQECVTLMQPQAEAEQLSLHCERPGPSIFIDADEQRLRQIVNNLISNAIKYTEEGQVRVRLSTTEEAGTPWLLLEVEDTGIGISADQHAAIFSEYVKVHTILNKRVNSTGLGLPITKRLVELHGGRVELTSTPGQGSCFSVYLPRVIPSPTE